MYLFGLLFFLFIFIAFLVSIFVIKGARDDDEPELSLAERERKLKENQIALDIRRKTLDAYAEKIEKRLKEVEERERRE